MGHLNRPIERLNAIIETFSKVRNFIPEVNQISDLEGRQVSLNSANDLLMPNTRVMY